MISFKRLPVTKTATWSEIRQKITDNTQRKGDLLLGVHSDAESYPDGTSAADVAEITELGDDESGRDGVFWLRKSITAENKYLKEKFTGIAKLLHGNLPMIIIAMKELGRRMIEKIRDHVYHNDIGMPPNSPATIERKGGNTPMIDTSHMIRQVDYKIVDNGKYS